MIRFLSPTENRHAKSGVYVGYVVQARGALNTDALSVALGSVRRAYPVLGAQIKPVGDRYALTAAVGDLPGVSQCSGDLSDPLAGFGIDQRHGLCAVHVVRDGDRSGVALVIHHAIADARHAVAVLEAFWSSYTLTVEGGKADLGGHGYPDSVEKILSDRGIGTFEYPPHPVHSPAGSGAAVFAGPPVSASRMISCDTPTADLLGFGRRVNLTLNALVSAAIIRAEAEERGKPCSEIPYYITVDMRRRLTPPVEPTAGTNVISMVGFTAAGEIGSDFLGLARGAAERVHDALEDKEDFYREALEPARRYRPGSVVTTNWGSIPALRSPEGLVIEGLRGALYNPIRAGGVPVASRAASRSLYVIHSFEGKTRVETMIGDPGGREAAQRKIRRVRSILTELPGSAK